MFRLGEEALRGQFFLHSCGFHLNQLLCLFHVFHQVSHVCKWVAAAAASLHRALNVGHWRVQYFCDSSATEGQCLRQALLSICTSPSFLPPQRDCTLSRCLL